MREDGGEGDDCAAEFVGGAEDGGEEDGEEVEVRGEVCG